MISAHYARVLHRNATAIGLGDKELLDNTGLTVQRIWGTAKLEPREFLALLSNARRLLPDEFLGFEVAGRNRLIGLGMMGVAMVSAPRLRDGLQAMVGFSTLEAGYLRFKVSVGQPETTVLLLIDDLVGDTLDLHVESVMSLLQEYLEDIVGNMGKQLRFNISYPEQGRRERYEQHLHGSIYFNQPVNGLVFPTDWLNQPSPHADTDLWYLARRYLTDQLQNAKGAQATPFSSHLRSVLSAQQPPLPDIPQMAESMHLSTRTLNRRLKEEGTTFRQLKLEAVHAWSTRMLLDGWPVEAVALELGYDNPANFRRSFREHMGKSPTEWLEQERQQKERPTATPAAL